MGCPPTVGSNALYKQKLTKTVVFMLMPETKGIPLESMDRLFEVRPARKAHKQIHDEDAAREHEFRQDAEGAGLSIAKEKLEHFEKSTEPV